MNEQRTTSDGQSRRRLEDVPVSVRGKLAALWVGVMFLYVYVDIFAFYKPGTIDDILVGRVWEFDISQGWALGALVLMTIPSLMVFMSVSLPARLARWTNIVVGSAFTLVTIGNVVGETWAFYWFGSLVETVLLLLIVWYAWTWPRLDQVAEQTSPAYAVASTLPSAPIGGKDEF